jgi:hypothetical protein
MRFAYLRELCNLLRAPCYRHCLSTMSRLVHLCASLAKASTLEAALTHTCQLQSATAFTSGLCNCNSHLVSGFHQSWTVTWLRSAMSREEAGQACCAPDCCLMTHVCLCPGYQCLSTS